MKCNYQATQMFLTKIFACFKVGGKLTVLPEYPSGLGLVEADGFRRHLRRDDVPGHEEVHFVFKLHLCLFRPNPLVHLL